MVQRIASALLLVVLVLASSVPRGWMPATTTDGKMVLVICTPDGIVEQLVDLGDDHTPNEQMDDRSCPFGSASPTALTPAPVIVFTLASPMTARWQHRDFTHHSAGFDWRYDARGPPTLS